MSSVQHALTLLRGNNIETAALDVSLILAHVLGKTREEILFDPLVLTAEQQVEFDALVARRVNREPMSQIIGRREFYGRDFIVTGDVLTPRPDTETLIETILDIRGSRIGKQPAGPDSRISILDLGTGTGCILLTLLAELPHAKGVAVDISRLALEVAKANASALGILDRTDFIEADMAVLAELAQAPFDIIVSNPPYIPSADIADLMPEVAKYEPIQALDGGKDGLDYYRILAKNAGELLKADGLMCMEIGDTQAAQVSDIFTQAGFGLVSLQKDLAGKDRCMVFSFLSPPTSAGL